MEELAIPTLGWRKSTYSVTGECVEVGKRTPGLVAVRDNKDATGLQLIFASRQWQEFVRELKYGA